MLMNTITSQSKKWRGYLLTHFGSPTGAAGAASCTAADPAHDACLQQLLSPGVQTVQLLHDSWDSNSHVIVMAHQCRINIGCHGQNVWFIYIIQSPTQVKTLSALRYPVLCGLLYTARSALQRSPRLCATWTHFKNMSNRFDVSNTRDYINAFSRGHIKVRIQTKRRTCVEGNQFCVSPKKHLQIISTLITNNKYLFSAVSCLDKKSTSNWIETIKY